MSPGTFQSAGPSPGCTTGWGPVAGRTRAGGGGGVTLGPPEMDSFHVPLEQKVRSAY